MADYPPLDMDDIMPFGKHRGAELRELVAEEPGYLIWCRDNIGTRFSEEIAYALKNHESGMEG